MFIRILREIMFIRIDNLLSKCYNENRKGATEASGSPR